MSKQRSFFSKIIERVKQDEGFRWEPDYLHWLREVRDCVQLDIRCPYHNLAGSQVMSLQQESFVRALDEQRIAHQNLDEAYVYPGLSVAWENDPVAVELSGKFGRLFLGQDEQAGELCHSVCLSNLSRLFPGCLLIDTRKLGFTLHGVELEGLFVYPSYDVERGYALLLLVGVSIDNGLSFPLQSKLVLKGASFADAVAASHEERDFLASMWWADGGEEGLVEIFSPLDDDQELMVFAARLLALLCSDRARLSRYDSPLWRCIDATTASSEAKARKERAGEQNEQPLAKGSKEPAQECGDTEQEALCAVEASGADSAPADEASPETPQARAIAALEKRIETLQARISSLNYSLEVAHATVEQLRADNESLHAQAHLLNNLEVPSTPLESLELARKLYSKQLVFLPQALKSAEEFKDGSAAETWSVLRSMATVLLPLYATSGNIDISKRFKEQAGFELALRDTGKTNTDPELQRLRTFEYKGDIRKATAHVKGRGSKSGKHLRVYYFFDSDEGKLVIAHCGKHLKSASTSKL